MQKKIALMLVLTGMSLQAHAGVYCEDTVTKVIVAGDPIYFTSSNSCPNWCQINPSWSADALKRAYALLLSARVSGTPVWFYWTDISVCGQVPTYDQPGTLME